MVGSKEMMRWQLYFRKDDIRLYSAPREFCNFGNDFHSSCNITTTSVGRVQDEKKSRGEFGLIRGRNMDETMRMFRPVFV
jgi:hypothetical protein